MSVMIQLILAAVLVLPSALISAEPQQAGVNARGVVESAEISGVDEDEISQDIRDAVRRLTGQTFDQQTADDLVARIQAEKPEFIATTRLLPGGQADRVKVVFFLEKKDVDAGAQANVNSRYIVERVEIQGFDESKLSQSIRDDLRKLVGERLDPDKADDIQHRIEDELRPRRNVVRRVVKGSDREHIVVIYDVRSVRWIPFVAQPPQHILYHSKQNFSAVINANIVDDNFNRFYFGLADDQDLLIERFAGFNFGVETTKLGTERLGLALRYARYHNRWQPATVLADQDAVYRNRNQFDPAMTFAFDPRVRLTAGISVSELQIQYPAIHNANANAVVGSLAFQNSWGRSDEDRHAVQAAYDFRAGNHTLDSDFIYTRHFVSAQYVYGHRRNRLMIGFLAGTIAGNAPLFERFSLGNTSTLRGWNKFDVAPAGGNRVVHATVQYGIGGPRAFKGVSINVNGQQTSGIGFGFHVFYDTGAVGNRGSPIQARHSAGFGFGGSRFFIELGFPIRSSRVQPIFMTGFRF